MVKKNLTAKINRLWFLTGQAVLSEIHFRKSFAFKKVIAKIRKGNFTLSPYILGDFTYNMEQIWIKDTKI